MIFCEYSRQNCQGMFVVVHVYMDIFFLHVTQACVPACNMESMCRFVNMHIVVLNSYFLQMYAYMSVVIVVDARIVHGHIVK